MLEGFGARFHVCRVHASTRIEPGDVRWGRDREDRCRRGGGRGGEGAVVFETAAHGIFTAGTAAGRDVGWRRRGHSYHVRQVRRCDGDGGGGDGGSGVMTVSPAFPVVAFGGLCCRRAQRGEGLIVLEVGLVVWVVRGRGARGMAASGAGIWSAGLLLAWAGGDEGGQTWRAVQGDVLLLLLLGQHGVQDVGVDRIAIFVGIARRWLKCGERVVVLQLEVRGGSLCLWCAGAALDVQLLHQCHRVVAKEAGCAGEAGALQPELAHVVLHLVSEAAVGTRARARGEPVAADDRGFLGLGGGGDGAGGRGQALAHQVGAGGGLWERMLRGRRFGGVHHQGVNGLAEVVRVRLEHLLELFVAALVVLQDGTQHVVRAHLRRIWRQEVRAGGGGGGGGGGEADVAVAGTTARIVIHQPVDRVAAVIAVILRRRGGITELVRAETRAVRDGRSGHRQTRGRPGRGERRGGRG